MNDKLRYINNTILSQASKLRYTIADYAADSQIDTSSYINNKSLI